MPWKLLQGCRNIRLIRLDEILVSLSEECTDSCSKAPSLLYFLPSLLGKPVVKLWKFILEWFFSAICQEITQKLLEACSEIAGSSLEQVTFFRRNLAVKPGKQMDVNEMDEMTTDVEVEGKKMVKISGQFLMIVSYLFTVCLGNLRFNPACYFKISKCPWNVNTPADYSVAHWICNPTIKGSSLLTKLLDKLFIHTC